MERSDIKVPGHLAHGTLGVADNPAASRSFQLRRAGGPGPAGTESVSGTLGLLVPGPRPDTQDSACSEACDISATKTSAIFMQTIAPRTFFVGEKGGMVCT